MKSADIGAGATQAGASFYTRKATGLVRDVGISSTLFLNLAFMSVPYALLTATAGPSSFPNSSLVGIVVLAAVLCLPLVLLWGMLSQAMPRSGGDYVFNSRIINPVIGFAANFSVTTWYVLSAVSLAASIPSFGISAALSTIGALTGNQGLLNAATTVTGKAWQFGVGGLCIILVALLLSLDLRRAMRIYAVVFLASILGVVIALIATLVSSQQDFVAALASQGGNYAKMIADARAAGFSGGSGSIDWGATLGATPLAFFALGFGYATIYAGGEVRNARSIMTKSLLLAFGIGAVVILILLGLAARTFGETWLGAATYLGTSAPKQYPLASSPFYFYFVAILVRNTPLIVIMGASFALSFVVALVPTFLIASRSLFAWSFDRIIPERASYVNDRTHSPVVAMGVIGTASLIILAVVVFGPGQLYQLLFTAGLGEIPTFMIVAIAAAILPFRRPDLWQSSPITQRVAGIPVITLVGLVSLAVFALFFYSLLTNSALGANSTPGLVGMAIFAVLPFLIYGISYAVRRSRGVDLGLAFQTLPPE